MATNTAKRTTRRAGAHTGTLGTAPALYRRRGTGAAAPACLSGTLAAVTLPPILAPDIETDMPWGEVYKQLLSAYRRYSRLCGKVPHRAPATATTAGQQLQWLKGAMATLVQQTAPDVRTMAIYNQGQRRPYYWCLYKYQSTDSHMRLNTFPMQYIHWLEAEDSPFAVPLMQLYGWLLLRAGISSAWGNNYYSYSVDMAEEWAQYEIDEENYENAQQLVTDSQLYKRGGEAYKLYHRCISYANVAKPGYRFIKRVELMDGIDDTLQQWLLNGCKLLMRTDRKPLEQYQNPDEFETDEDSLRPIGLHDQYVVNWGGMHELLCEKYEEYINADYHEAGAYAAQSYVQVHGRSTRVFSYSTWFDDFDAWACKGSIMLNERLKKACYNNPETEEDE